MEENCVADSDPQTPDPQTPPPVTPEPTSEPKTITQDALTRIAAKEKSEGANAERARLLKEFGVESLDEAKKVFAERQQAEDAKKSELEKAAEREAKAKADGERAVAAAKQEAHNDRVALRLIASGLPRETVSDGEALADVVRLINAEVGSKSEDIDAKIEAVKVRFPQFFTASTTSGTPSSVPSGHPSGAPAGESAFDRGKKRAEEMMQRRGVVRPSS